MNAIPLSEALKETLSLFPNALVASLLVALACAVVGVHVVARRLIVVGLALPQMAALGIALSFLGTFSFLFFWAPPGADGLRHEAMAFLLELVGAGILALGARKRLLGNDAVAGVLFVAAGALTILVMMRSAQGLDEVKNLVEGNILTVGAPELGRLAWALLPVLLLLGLFGRPLLFSTFDRETAATFGVRTGLLEIVFFVCLAVVIASGVHSTGTLFVFGFLVLPGATGLVAGRSAVTVFLSAIVSALLAAGGGFVLSYAWDAPTGPMCVATMLAVFLLVSAASWAVRFVAARLGSRRLRSGTVAIAPRVAD